MTERKMKRKSVVIFSTVALLALTVVFAVGALYVFKLKKENISLKDQIEEIENKTSRMGGLEIPVEKSTKRIANDITEDDYITFPLPYSRYLRLTSPFGIRFSPTTGKLVFHPAIDICEKVNAVVYHAISGRIKELWLPKGTIVNGVVYQGHATRDGYMVVENDRYEVSYSHLSMVTSLRIGEYVEAGKEVGRTGRGGKATGDHLHFEVYDKKLKKYVDPILLFKETIEVDENKRIWFVEKLDSPVSLFTEDDYKETGDE